MIDEAITMFLDQRKEGWLKKNVAANFTEEEILQAQQTCNEIFSLAEWLPNAAKRAGQISIATHPCTFSHPSARKNKNGYVTSIIADTVHANDGYLRTGNVSVEHDALGNAAALDVYKFLNLKLSDGRTLLQHLEADSDMAKALFNIPTATYEELKNGFLAMVSGGADTVVTSSKIKQVYFVVDGDYHLLSVLTNSGMMFEMRQRLDALRFGEETKALRELRKNQQFSEQGYKEVYGLTTIGYGGTKPQNISVLNNQNGGKAHLLASVPPVLKQRRIRFPSQDIFQQNLYALNFIDEFKYLHKVMKIELGGNISRQNLLTARDNALKEIVLKVMDIVHDLRSVSAEQYRSESSNLSSFQNIWLVAENEQIREQQSDWLDLLIPDLVRWMSEGYEKVLGEQRILLGSEEFNEIKQLIELWSYENKEFLR